MFRFELATFRVRSLEFAERTELSSGVLRVDRHGLERRLADDPNFSRVSVDIARPGEDVRIIHVLDAVEPRVKVRGRGSAYPGFLGPAEIAGTGRTNRLAGIAVLETGQMPGLEERYRFMDEAVLDMSGPAAAYSPFAQTLNLVLSFEPAPGVSAADFDQSIRLAGLRTAAALAELTRERMPDEVETFELGPPDPSLPNVGYVHALPGQSLETMQHTFVYGQDITGTLPTLIHPNEVLDGAIVSGNYSYASNKHPTYLHVNNPVILDLYHRHGRSLNFAGIVISRTYGFSLAEKELLGTYSAKLLKLIGADGAVVTHEGGGHGEVDLMVHGQKCEEHGIKTVLITNVIAEDTSGETSLIDAPREVDAIVSTGNKAATLSLPSVRRVIGGTQVADVARWLPASESFPFRINHLYCASDHLGATRLRSQVA